LIGTAYGSTIESLDNPKEGMELNGLWVHRLVVYNFHHSGSNAFYKHLGFRVIETE